MTDEMNYRATCALCDEDPHTSFGTYETVGNNIWMHQQREHADDHDVSSVIGIGAYHQPSTIEGELVVQFTTGPVAIKLTKI